MTDGSHFQLVELDVQLVVVVSRNVSRVYDPAGKGPVLGEADGDGEGGGAELLRQTVSVSNRIGICQSDIPALLSMQANSKTNSQSHNAGYHDEREKTYSLPSSPPSNIGIVPQILKVLSLRTRDIPHAVSRRFLSISIPRRLSQKPSAERAMVWLLNARRWCRIAIFGYDG